MPDAGASSGRPAFLYVGPAKCGSSWLSQVLGEHPDIFIPPAKDIMYFDRHYDRPVDWYLSFFPADGRKSGEVCHNYFEHPEAARRIHALLPDVKLVFILREPVDRTVSHWLYEGAIGLAGGLDLEAFSRRPDIAAINDYHANLARYRAIFPPKQMLVLFYDELAADPAGLMRRVFAFLGVDADFSPPSLYRRVLAARRARSVVFSGFAYRIAQVLRATGAANFVGRVKSHPLFNRIAFRELEARPPLPLDVLHRMFMAFAPGYDELARLLGRPVPERWKIAPSKRQELRPKARSVL